MRNQMTERAPVPTWYLLLVRELMLAGNELADLLEDQPATAAAKDAVQRWETALCATGEGAI
jgi:hypothetical protein